MKKNLSAILLSTALVISSAFTAFGAVEDTGFSDVSADNSYLDGIQFCVDNGIIRRTAVTEFSPDDNFNRELFACVLYRLEESPATETDVTFTDVETGRWFQTGVIWAADSGILVGYGDGSFGVNDGLTREQLVVALWRYMGSPDVSGNITYSDADDIAPWAEEAVIWASQNNILDFYGDTFMPENIVTRAEAAEAIKNFLEIKDTPYMTNSAGSVSSNISEADFIERVRLTVEGVEGEAVVSLIDSKPTREFIAQLPMTVDFTDFGAREMFGAIPVGLSEDTALLSGYEIGDFSYGTPYDCLIAFYAQDNEVIDGIIKLGEFESRLDLFTGVDNARVTIEAVE